MDRELAANVVVADGVHVVAGRLHRLKESGRYHDLFPPSVAPSFRITKAAPKLATRDGFAWPVFYRGLFVPPPLIRSPPLHPGLQPRARSPG